MRTVDTAAVDHLPIERLIAVLSSHPVRLAILFGSHASETAHEKSDVDIAVEFASHQPTDEGYNDVFLGLSADLSEALDTDDVDLVDIHTLDPAVAEAVFSRGVLLVGDEARAAEIREQLLAEDSNQQSPRERLDAALTKIDSHLADDVPAAGEKQDR